MKRFKLQPIWQKTAALGLALALLLSVSGCHETAISTLETVSSTQTTSERLEALLEKDTQDDATDSASSEGSLDADSQTANGDASDAPTATTSNATDGAIGSFGAADIPTYNGEMYIVVNDNIPFFSESELTSDSFESYSNLDALGRCGAAIASIGQDIMPTEDRESISSVTPTGWVQASYDTALVSGGYLYNRAHLIGFQLTGENANKENLITGTRAFNVDAMLLFENMVADYVKETDNHVYYRVTPIFDGNDLLAKGVLMEAQSVEDDGDGILFNVFCYNVQDGIAIDYATGKSSLGLSIAASSTPAPSTNASGAIDASYVLNLNSKKIHMPDCRSVNDMSEANKLVTNENLATLHSQGYEDCKVCKPSEA